MTLTWDLQLCHKIYSVFLLEEKCFGGILFIEMKLVIFSSMKTERNWESSCDGEERLAGLRPLRTGLTMASLNITAR